jgi:peptidoglycan/LPS O-acetylase OafA/YrhL
VDGRPSGDGSCRSARSDVRPLSGGTGWPLATPPFTNRRVEQRDGSQRDSAEAERMHSDDGKISQDAIPPSLARPLDRPELGVLTSVRALAALQVVLLHTLFELGGNWAQALPAAVVRVLTQGQVAVSFFFVLSGFILAYTYCQPAQGLRGTPERFWRARFARIYPLYVLAFVLDLPRGVSFFLGANASPVGAWGRIAISGLAYLALLQSWYPRVTNSWNTPGWSLSVEAFFYAVFPRLIAATRRDGGRRLLIAGVAAWAIPLVLFAVVARSHAAVIAQPAVETFWRSFPPLRLPEFMLGVGTGTMFVSGRLQTNLKSLRWAGFAAIGLVLVLLGAPLHLPKALVENTLEAPLFAIMIAAAAAGALRAPVWLLSKPFIMLGRASYAVYIVHQPFKALFVRAAAQVGLDSPSPWLLIAYLVSLQALCVGLFVWIEDPCRRLIARRPLGPRRQVRVTM